MSHISLDDVDSVSDRHDLATYINLLRLDMRRNPEEYENLTLDDYLEALAAFITDMDGYCKNRGEKMPEHPSWSMIASCLAAASIYE